jgi:hypothetical protein
VARVFTDEDFVDAPVAVAPDEAVAPKARTFSDADFADAPVPITAAAPRAFSEADFADRPDRPGVVGAVADVGAGLARGVLAGGETVLRAARTTVPSETFDAAVASPIEALKEAQGYKWLQPSQQAGESGLRRSLSEGSQSATQSLVGMAPGVVAGTMTAGPVGAVVGGATSGGTIFGLAQYDQLREDFLKRTGQDIEKVPEAWKAAIKSSLSEAGTEAASDLASSLIFGKAGMAAGKAIGSGALNVAKQAGKTYVKGVAKAIPFEVGGEAVNAAYQDTLNPALGLERQGSLEAAKQVVGPSLVTTALMGAGQQAAGAAIGRPQAVKDHARLVTAAADLGIPEPSKLSVPQLQAAIAAKQAPPAPAMPQAEKVDPSATQPLQDASAPDQTARMGEILAAADEVKSRRQKIYDRARELGIESPEDKLDAELLPLIQERSQGEPEKYAFVPESGGHSRANKGGEIAPNNEYYKGGQFIATTELPKRERDELDRIATGKRQVARGVWEVPGAGDIPILHNLIGSGMGLDGRTNDQYLSSLESEVPNYVQQVRTAAEQYRAGEKYVRAEEYPALVMFDDIVRYAKAGKVIPAGLWDNINPNIRANIEKKFARVLKRDTSQDNKGQKQSAIVPQNITQGEVIPSAEVQGKGQEVAAPAEGAASRVEPAANNAAPDAEATKATTPEEARVYRQAQVALPGGGAASTVPPQIQTVHRRAKEQEALDKGLAPAADIRAMSDEQLKTLLHPEGISDEAYSAVPAETPAPSSPVIDIARVQQALPAARVEQNIEGGGFFAHLPNDHVVWVMPTGEIQINKASALKGGYSESQIEGGKVEGAWKPMGQDSLIKIVNGEELDHEVWHDVTEYALSPAELLAVRKMYNDNWEAAARSYNRWVKAKRQGPNGNVWQKVYDFALRLKDMIVTTDKSAFRAVESGKAYQREAGGERALRMPDRLPGESQEAYMVRAFQGGPHRIEGPRDYTLSKSGTGEGAAAYGWGAYFASLKDVAQEYKERLSGKVFKKSYRLRGRNLSDIQGELEDKQEYIKAGMLEKIQLHQTQREVSDWLNEHEDSPRLEEVKKYFKSLPASLFTKTDAKGYLYHAELDVNDEDLLDWDKPLSEQSEKVKKALNDGGAIAKLKKDVAEGQGTYTLGNATGEDLYAALRQQSSDFKKGGQGKEAASRYLASIGIPGIRYLDGGSRGKGDGTHNYVIFDDKLITLTHRNDEPMPAPDRESYSLSESDTLRQQEREASGPRKAMIAERRVEAERREREDRLKAQRTNTFGGDEARYAVKETQGGKYIQLDEHDAFRKNMDLIPESDRQFFKDFWEGADPKLGRSSSRTWTEAEQMELGEQLISTQRGAAKWAKYKPGRPENAALIRLTGAMATRTWDAVKIAQAEVRANPGSADAVANLNEAMARMYALEMQLSGRLADAARGLQAGNAVRKARLAKDPSAKAMAALAGRGMNLTEAELQEFAQLDPDNVLLQNKFINKVLHDRGAFKFKDWINAYRYFNMLSGTNTHAYNIISNALWMGDVLVKQPLQIILDAPNAVRGRGKRTYYVQDYLAGIKGSIAGMPAAMQSALDILRFGVSKQQATTQLDTDKYGAPREAPGGGKNPLNWTGRALGAMDAVFATSRTLGAVEQLATRKAIQDGNASKKRITELMQDETIMAQAVEEGKRATFTEDAVAQKLLTQLDRISPSASKVVRVLFPFVRVAENITKRGINMTPAVGMARSWRGQGKAQQILAEQTMGVGIALLGYSLAAAGEATGPPPDDEKGREKFFDEGKQAYSVKINGRWYRWNRLGPLAFPFAVGTALNDVIERGGKMNVETATVIGNSLGKMFTDMSLMQGLGNIVDATSKPVTAGSKLLASTVGQLVPAAAQLRQWEQSFDEHMRDPKAWYERIAAGIPLLDKTVEKRVSQFGQDVHRTTTGVNAFIPGIKEGSVSDPAIKEINRLGIDYPGKPGAIEAKGVKYILTPEQERQRLRDTGEKILAAVQARIDRDGYDRMDEDSKIEAIENAMGKAVSASRKKWKKEYLDGLHGAVTEKTILKRRPKPTPEPDEESE